MSEKVTFQELIDSIAEETDNSKQFTHDFLKDFVSVINEGLEKEGNVNIAGFGKFKLRKMDEREGYNPQSGENITIPAHNKVVFKPYKDLRNQVNAPYSHLESEIIEEEDADEPSDRPEKPEESEEKEFIPTAPPTNVESEEETAEDESGEFDEEEETPWEAEESEESEDIDDPFDFVSKSPEETGELESEEEEPASGEETEDEDIVEYTPGTEASKEEDEEPEPEETSSRLDQYMSDFRKKSSEDEEEPEEELPAEEPETEEEEPEPVFDEAATGPAEEEIADEPAYEEPAPEETEEESHRRGSGIDFGKAKRQPEANRFLIIAAALVIVLLVAFAGIWLFYMDDAAQSGESVTQQATPDQPRVEQPAETQEPEEETPAQDQAGDETGTETGSQDNQQEPAAATPTTHTVAKGETLWSLAEREYDNPYLWPWIYDSNKASIANPNLIQYGRELTLPATKGSGNSLGENDSLEVAVGYVSAYQWFKENESEDAKYYLWAAKKFDKKVFDHTNIPIDEEDLAFANRVR